MGLSAAGEARVLTGLLDSVYLSLHTGDPGATGVSEVSGGSYSRKSAAFTQTGDNPTTASNSSVIQFTQSTANWGNVTHFGIWDSASGGNFLAGGPVDTPRTMITGDIARWEVGDLEVTTD
jgi:hypothetical protein